MQPGPITVCFDLDGTLINTAPDLLAALDHCLLTYGHKAADHSHIMPIIGQGAKAMLRRALSREAETATAAPTPLADSQIDEMWQTLIEHYTIHIADQSHPYEGVMNAITRLKDEKMKLAICTNKPMFLTEPLLEKLGISDVFDAICGADSFPFKKPDPRHLNETILKAGGTPARGLMIGDSRTDVETARNAALPVIGFDGGYTDIPMKDLQPDALISHYDELTSDLVRSLFT